ncbi:hypothetical protein AVEN_53571-1 [Araneus ventricosus]|uniref:DUF5641 domain-containing protein n=1 Tax=Araneus ventricosus TaxID=182803 RepID=A0A4Y2NUY1_ARAVE|nr:hypothetical protein AVEN_53571-1 [Araneus ventricosus]
MVGRLVGKVDSHSKGFVKIHFSPVTHVSENPEEYNPHTPSMFLIESRSSNTEDVEELISRSLNKRIKYRSKLFRRNCGNALERNTLATCAKSFEKHPRNPQVGEIVFVGEDNKKRWFWAMVKII